MKSIHHHKRSASRTESEFIPVISRLVRRALRLTVLCGWTVILADIQAATMQKLAEKPEFIVRGTVKQLGVAAMPIVPADDNNAVIVKEVLRAPEMFRCTAKSGLAEAMAAAHLTLLNKLDLFPAMRELYQGDPADILQMVKWEKEIHQRQPVLRKLSCSSGVVNDCDEFIRGYPARKIKNKDYPGFVKRQIERFHETAVILHVTKGSLQKSIEAMDANLASLVALQKAHRSFLIEPESRTTPGKHDFVKR